MKVVVILETRYIHQVTVEVDEATFKEGDALAWVEAQQPGWASQKPDDQDIDVVDFKRKR